MSIARASAIQPLVPALRPLTETLSPFAEPMLRAATGLLLIPHGLQKLFGWFGGYGLEATGQFFATKLGLPASFALLAGLIEVLGGLALALGLATRAVAGLVVGMMLVAVFQVHLGKGFFWTAGGYEYPLFWGIAALAFAVKGGGRYSLDALIGREI